MSTRSFIAALAMCFLLSGGVSTRVSAQDAYAGVWREGKDGYALWVGDTWAGFEAKWQELSGMDLRLIDLETQGSGVDRTYSGVFRKGSDGYALWVGDSWSGFEAKWAELSRQNLRLIDLETYVEDGKRLYGGVFEAGTDAYALWVGDTWAGFEAKWQELSSGGLRLIDLETYVEGGVRLYSGVFRAGTDAHYLWVGDTWAGFTAKWQELAARQLRLIDIETYLVNNQRRWTGVWREGNDSYGLWAGVDFENLVARWHSWADADLRLIDLERYPGCRAECANQVVADSSYNYLVTGEGWYRWPVDSDASGDYIRLSAVHFSVTPFLSLPFDDPDVKRTGAWRYSGGGYHHALDYARPDVDTFEIHAAAPGEVIFQGWDNWSGNTVIISHTVDGEPDAYRTLYMHVRNGAGNDCSNAWSESVPAISGENLSDFVTHLNESGCTQNPADRNLDAAHWGTNAQTFPALVGQQVAAGQLIAWAGNTGPGGKRGSGGPNTHLHFFVTRRDPTNNEFYFIDPYGIYAKPSCYPSELGGADNGPCGRYPNIWGGERRIFNEGFEWGDLTNWLIR